MNRRWTEEELLLLIEKRNKRIRKMRHQEAKPEAKTVQLGAKYLNDPAFLAQHKVN